MANLITRREFLLNSIGTMGLLAIGMSPSSSASQLDKSQLAQDTIPNLEVILSCDKEVYKAKDLKSWDYWENCPRIDANIYNRSNKSIWLVRVLDGSEVRWRFPYCYFEVFDSKGNKVNKFGGGRCGNMNAIRRSDYVLVQPNEGFNPYYGPFRLADFDVIRPDRYKALFTYSTSSANDTDWLGDLGDNDTQLLHLVPRNIELKKEVIFQVI
ncbi:MAG TPA: hypothetical protein VJH20_01440 [Candidatus Nanoarchaeia archaeon]|nr:hypothetical protein [Candidatus Nanoarchaeia archaeon]